MDYLESFERWLEYQKLAGKLLPADVEERLRSQYVDALDRAVAQDPSRWMSKSPVAGEYRYAVVIDDGKNQWVTLCVKRSPRGEYFVLVPREREWDPHASYHLDGEYHQKSYGTKVMVQQHQRLDQFKGTEHLGNFMGHGTGSALYKPQNYTAALIVSEGVLTGLQGQVLVDLVEPDHSPAPHHREIPGMKIHSEQTYKDASPWIVIAAAVQTREVEATAPPN